MRVASAGWAVGASLVRDAAMVFRALVCFLSIAMVRAVAF